MNEKGKLFVISGPSGAGKSTVVFKAMEGRDDLCFSTSVTTRKPRPGEVDGREYFFVDLERFDEMVKEEEEYRLGNIMPMDQVREKVKKIIAKEGNYCRD